MSLLMLPEAEDDVARAVAWHELQRPGRGAECDNAIEASLRSIEAFPRIGGMYRPPCQAERSGAWSSEASRI